MFCELRTDSCQSGSGIVDRIWNLARMHEMRRNKAHDTRKLHTKVG
jgi:hypothetical protein